MNKFWNSKPGLWTVEPESLFNGWAEPGGIGTTINSAAPAPPLIKKQYTVHSLLFTKLLTSIYYLHHFNVQEIAAGRVFTEC